MEDKATIRIGDLFNLTALIKDKGFSQDTIYHDLADMGINPTLFYIRENHEILEIDKKKLMVFKIKYAV